MVKKQPYRKFIDVIKKEEFISFFSAYKNPENLFSQQELRDHPFPDHAKSLAGRYLIKRTILKYIGETGNMNEIEILNDAFGKPEISLGSNIQLAIEQSGVTSVLCSITHSRNLIAGMTLFCF